MRALNLKCEYLTNPIGIDIPSPRLMWICEGGKKQTAYEVETVKNGKPDWQSGKVGSSSMRCVFGGELASRAIIKWRVRLYDESGMAGEWSETVGFEIGLLSASDWSATWITGNYRPKTKRNILRAYVGGNAERYPVDCFRRIFSCENIAKARLYITACGLYEAKLNGERVGNFILAPGYTDYNKRIQYQTYDVTGMIKSGENTLCIALADGWYRGSVGAWGLLCEYGCETKFLAQLELSDADGNNQLICTDGTWNWSNDGPIRFADNKDGEIFDANCLPSYAGKAKVTRHGVIPSASNNVQVTEHEVFKPSVITTPSGKTVLDFGQNIAGYIAFDFIAKVGQEVRMRFGELLDNKGEFTQTNIQCTRKGRSSPLQQVIYRCREGENRYKTTFAVFGFRYVLLETNCEWKPNDFSAIAVYSDMERTGKFTCSNQLINKFVEITVWSAKNNHLDVPTDCPTRERHGWTGDAQIFFRSASYLFDYAAFSRKYLLDIYDWQKKSGKLPQIAPYGGVDFFMAVMNGSVGWSDAGVLIPYRFWKHYGDADLLKDLYPRMRSYAKFMEKRIGKWYLTAKPTGLNGRHKKNIVNCGQSFGEWAEPSDVHPTDWFRNMAVPHPEESTAYTSYVMRLMSEIAGFLGKTGDAEHYKQLSEKTRLGYIELRKEADYSPDTDRQATLVRPLYMNLLDESQTEFAKKRLIQALDNYGWRLGTGFLSTPFILYVLADIDIEAAYRLLENEKMPGWLFMPKSGANTVWESWEGTSSQSGIASLDHYSKGATCEWLFDSCCGIKVDCENHFTISPKPGGTLAFATAEYKSIYGTVTSGWRKEDGNITYTVSIPSNCNASIILPNSQTLNVSEGIYTF